MARKTLWKPKWERQLYSFGMIDGKVAVVTDENGVGYAVVKYEDGDVRLEVLLDLLENLPVEDLPRTHQIALNHPDVRAALGMN